MSEQFRHTMSGWAESSEGYAVRLLGRTRLEYRDSFGRLSISAEAMSKPWNKIVVYTDSIPDTAERPRNEVLDRLQRAFVAKGWTLVTSPE